MPNNFAIVFLLQDSTVPRGLLLVLLQFIALLFPAFALLINAQTNLTSDVLVPSESTLTQSSSILGLAGLASLTGAAFITFLTLLTSYYGIRILFLTFSGFLVPVLLTLIAMLILLMLSGLVYRDYDRFNERSRERDEIKSQFRESMRNDSPRKYLSLLEGLRTQDPALYEVLRTELREEVEYMQSGEDAREVPEQEELIRFLREIRDIHDTVPRDESSSGSNEREAERQ